MEKTYIFHEKNGSGLFAVSATSEDEAIEYMKKAGLRPHEWILGEIE